MVCFVCCCSRSPWQPGTPFCTVCRKSYASANAMEQHLKSKKHLAKAKGESDRTALCVGGVLMAGLWQMRWKVQRLL